MTVARDFISCLKKYNSCLNFFLNILFQKKTESAGEFYAKYMQDQSATVNTLSSIITEGSC